MLDIEMVIQRIKEVLEDEYKNKVLDKNVAYELGISNSTLSTMKSRKLVPYDALTSFCYTRKINTNWLFFGIGSMEMNYA